MYHLFAEAPNDFCQPNRGMIGNACLRPVGTRGGRGEGWGPRACPGGMTSGLGSVRPTGLIPTRTSTRPPHPPHSTPCPYRKEADIPNHSAMRLAKIIRHSKYAIILQYSVFAKGARGETRDVYINRRA